MKLILIIVFGVIGLCCLLALIGGLVLNARIDKRPEAAEFLHGTYPQPALDGPYAGNHFDGLGKDWRGKQFFAVRNQGINNFALNGQRYPFATSRQKGLRNGSLDVLQLNYDQADNPWWLRFIRDELVQVRPGTYLGKIHVKVGTFIITLGYFRLSSQ